MKKNITIGVDLGGTNVRAARISGPNIERLASSKISADKEKKVIINEMIDSIKMVINENVSSIGVGVPSVLDIEKGIVYNVINIPSWDEVHLKMILQDYFKVPVSINNDVNCFTLGEKLYGKGKKYRNFVGLALGTGMGSGIIVNNYLYTGSNCGAGEFGTMPYKDKTFEDYCSGMFFKSNNLKGEDVYNNAKDGYKDALILFSEMGFHLGEAIKSILLAVDPEAIIIGGSVSKAFSFFEKSMYKSLSDFPFKEVIKKLKVELSTLNNAALLGASSLGLK